MYSEKIVQNKWKKTDKHSVRAETDCEHELVKYRTHIFIPPKFMRLNKSKLQCVREIFQVVSP